MKTNLIRHINPSHSWLQVSLNDLKDSGFNPSPYSYVDSRNGFAYLEEDCDMGGFLIASGLWAPDKPLPYMVEVYHKGDPLFLSKPRFNNHA